MESKYLDILKILGKIYTIPPRNRGRTPLEELILVILSQNTSDNNSFLAYKDLFDRFDDYREIARGSEQELALSIRRGGLANVKARRLKKALESIYDWNGSYSLDFLEELDDEAALDYLTSLEGVGPKSSRCVLMFTLGRDVIPVDTHVFRVSKRIGIIDPDLKSREKACEILESIVKPSVRYRLHMCLIYHGRAVCKARKPGCNNCEIAHFCDYYSQS